MAQFLSRSCGHRGEADTSDLNNCTNVFGEN